MSLSSLAKEDQEALRLLVQHVLRAFYEPRFTVVVDQLVRHTVIKDDDLAGRMGLALKELGKVMAVLENDRLIRVYRQNELKEGAQRSVGRQYYYIDYQHFCNVVKWRVAEMHRRIDTTLRNQLDNKGYICPQCGKSFSPLEVDKLVDHMAGTFNCDICHAELTDNENAESVRGSQDRMQRFNRQMRFIREGLRRSEDMVMPAFDVALWIKTHIIDVERAKAAAASGGLKFAGAGGDGAPQADAIGVVLSVDKDEATQRAERDRAAAAKRMQNVLPAWHLKSTISGDLTALGVREEEDKDATERLPSSNDAILRGLAPAASAAQDDAPQTMGRGGEEVKPDVVLDREADYYDQYYASLAASSGAPPVPSLEQEEEEDVKPSVAYLDSLNAYRKRSRSRSAERGRAKTPKLAGYDSPHDAEPPEPVDAAGQAADDPMVYVNGEPVPFSSVTDEQQDLMTPEEYEAWWEVAKARL
ncbi:hypothetical protein BDW22DRAFT_1364381 [Trametopsis cervina]|nr:hypothetical protein BDW22DRAFT_1364381 [Trametopsis cervina]